MSIIRRAASQQATQEFTQRAACAWIRAADAGIIDADELGWLLTQLQQVSPGGEAAAIMVSPHTWRVSHGGGTHQNPAQ